MKPQAIQRTETRRRTLFFRIYLQWLDLIMAIGVTLLDYWVIRKSTAFWIIPLLYFVVAGTGNWLMSLLGRRREDKYPWQWGLQWPPHWFIGRVFYDGWHYVAQFGPVWIGREP